MKKLLLKKVPVGKSGKFRYEVIEDDKVIATRTSARDYYGCYVTGPHKVSANQHNKQEYQIANCFGTAALMQKFDVAKYIGTPYASATFDSNSMGVL